MLEAKRRGASVEGRGPEGGNFGSSASRHGNSPVSSTDKSNAISRKFPKEEQFALLPQIRRASTSVGSNIAEGSGRNSDADFGHFLEIAYGSLMEVVSELFVALDENYIPQEQFDAIADEADLLAGKIVNLSKSLGRTARFTKPLAS